MTSSDLFSHPTQPENVQNDRHSTEPVSNPVFSDKQQSDSRGK